MPFKDQKDQRIASQRYYERNRERLCEEKRLRRVKRKGRIALLKVQRGGCVDCGEKDPRVLDFDHREGETKCMEIGSFFARAAWSDVLAEVEKCDVRCANCHRKTTARRRARIRR